MHPSKFFEEVSCRTDIDVFEMFDDILKDKLKNVHPLNFIKSRIELPVYKVTISFYTKGGEYKEQDKYMVMDSSYDPDEDYADFWADIFIKENFKEKGISNLTILDTVHICDAVLPIG